MTKSSRSWDAIRGKSREAGEPTPARKEVLDAFQIIGRSPEGEAVKEWLSEQILMRPPPRAAPDGALRDIAAEQRVAHRFLKLLQGPPDDAGTKRK